MKAGLSRGQELALLAGLKLAVSAALLLSGFHGISDDDFARVVIAQDFAHDPKLDPSGTSWLPFPFWLNGGAMLAFGSSMQVARAMAIVCGVASVLLVRIAAEWLTEDRASAFAGAALVAVLPWSVRLGVSTVPELPTAALTFLAVASLAPGGPAARRLAGGVALFCATLSRYEPWFVAIGFVGVLAYESIRARRVRLTDVVASAVALSGPIGWTAWNQHAHGSPLHYLDRVAAYKQAIDQGAVAGRVFDYVFATFRAEPELLILAGYLLYRWLLVKPRDTDFFRPFLRPALVLAFLFATLTVSSVKGGAPTHHAERALLVIHITLAVLVGAWIVRTMRAKNLGSPLVLTALVIAVLPALYIVRSWLLYKEAFANRRDEIRIGEEVARAVPESDRILVEVIDYGFFAVQAGAARPWSFELSSPIKPGQRPAKLSLDALASRARDEQARYLVATSGPPTADLEKIACHGWWCLYILTEPT